MKQSPINIVIGILFLLLLLNRLVTLLEPFCTQCGRVQTAWVYADPNNLAGLSWVL